MQGLPIHLSNFPRKYLGLPLSTRGLKTIDVQPLINKAASMFTPWYGTNIAMAGRGTHVKSVVTSQAIFHLMPLVIPPNILQTFNKLERSIFWVGTHKVMGANARINWKSVCRPKEKGSLGIIDHEKFARALRLCWPWLHWKDPSKAWIGNELPCDEADMDLFYAATTITIGDGCTVSFWHSPWLDGSKPNERSIFDISTWKNFIVHKAYLHDFWVAKLNTSACIYLNQKG
jgi:hypothetical protein